MQSRESRALAVHTFLDLNRYRPSDHLDTSDPTPPVPGWTFPKLRSGEGHPIDGHPMAYARRRSVRPEGVLSHSPHALSHLVVTGIRTGADAASIEVSAAVVFQHSAGQLAPLTGNLMGDLLRTHGPGPFAVLDAPSRPGYHGTALARVAWKLPEGVAVPDVVALRFRPVLTPDLTHVCCFTWQLPANHDEPSSGGPVVESVLSGRTTSFGAGAELVFGFPFIDQYQEIVVRQPLANLEKAVAEVKRRLTPAAAQ